ncbi:MAG: hypothetical protein WBW75_27615 [Mycobacterium sp.]|uniref:hypothetical protein n=1 Tax=Mycobacterium sp. TaxID=1785 RepID=UPI003C564D8A
MDAQDAAPQEPIDTDAAATVIPVITAAGLGLDGEHGPLFSDIALELTAGRGNHLKAVPNPASL